MKPHDGFAKNYLEELLSSIGTVEISKEVTDETRQIDVFFSPNPDSNADYLGLLGRIVRDTVLIEPYRNPPNRNEIRTCLVKLATVLARLQRQAKRENQPFDEENSPRLWIFSPSASLSLLEGFGATVREDWPDGVFFLPPFHRTAIIAINQLPVCPDTLWIRLLGRGNVQDRAVREVLELPGENAFRRSILELLISWRVSIEIKNTLEEEDREVFMTLSQTYLEWKEATERKSRQEGRQEGRLEVKLESIPRLLALGLTVEQIASALDLEIERVRQVAEN